jgi:hypothetical protein
VLSYDPQRDTWQNVQVNSLLSPHGIVSMPRASWVGYESGSVASVAAFLSVGAVVARAGDGPCERSHSPATAWPALGDQHVGRPEWRIVATRFDPDKSQVTAQVPVGGPRGGGDLSGSAFAANFVPEARRRRVRGLCARR